MILSKLSVDASPVTKARSLLIPKGGGRGRLPPRPRGRLRQQRQQRDSRRPQSVERQRGVSRDAKQRDPERA